jgi:hypothetical protein
VTLQLRLHSTRPTYLVLPQVASASTPVRFAAAQAAAALAAAQPAAAARMLGYALDQVAAGSELLGGFKPLSPLAGAAAGGRVHQCFFPFRLDPPKSAKRRNG